MLINVNMTPDEEKRLSQIPELDKTIAGFLRNRLSLEDWRSGHHEDCDLAEAWKIIEEAENEAPLADEEVKQRFWKLYDRINQF